MFCFVRFGRGGEIRTHDPPAPKAVSSYLFDFFNFRYLHFNKMPATCCALLNGVEPGCSVQLQNHLHASWINLTLRFSAQ